MDDRLLRAAMRSREADIIARRGAELPDDGGRRFRNPRSPPVEKRFGNVFHHKTKPVQSQMEITWPEHHAA